MEHGTKQTPVVALVLGIDLKSVPKVGSSCLGLNGSA